MRRSTRRKLKVYAVDTAMILLAAQVTIVLKADNKAEASTYTAIQAAQDEYIETRSDTEAPERDTKNMLQDYEQAKYTYNGNLLTEYEGSQIMRKMERSVRESKRTLTGYDSAVKNATDAETENSMKEAFQEEAVKLKQKEKKLKDFCSQTGMTRDTSRTQVYAVKDQAGNVVGYGRSTSMKAVWANRKAVKR